MKDLRLKSNQLIVISKEAPVWSLPLENPRLHDCLRVMLPLPLAATGRAVIQAASRSARRTCRRCIPYGSSRNVRKPQCVRAARPIGHHTRDQASRRRIDQTQSARALTGAFSGRAQNAGVRPGRMSLKAWPYGLRRFIAIRTNLAA